MKVLFIIPDYGSFDNFLSELAISLLKLGWKVEVICAFKKIIPRKDKFPYDQLGIIFHFTDFVRGFNPLKHLKASRNIHRLIDQITPDLVSIHFTTGIFTTLVLKKPKAITLGMLHGLHSATIPNPLARKAFRQMEHLLFKRLNELWMLNQQDFDALHPRSSQKFLVTAKGLGCDLEKFNRGNYSPDMIKSMKIDLGITDEVVLMYTGRFVQFKGFPVVIKAFLNLVKNSKVNTGLKLILAGGYDPVHPSGLTAAEKNRLNACPHIIQTGFTDQTERYLALSDVFLFPSIREGMPVVVMEALAMGVPVITADSRGCNELVFPGKNGILLSSSPGVEELEQAIIRLAANKELREQFSSYALQHRDDLSRKHFIDEQIAHFQQLAETLNR